MNFTRVGQDQLINLDNVTLIEKTQIDKKVSEDISADTEIIYAIKINLGSGGTFGSTLSYTTREERDASFDKMSKTLANK